MGQLLDLVTLVDNVPLDFEHNYSPYYRLFLSPSDPRPHGYMLPDTVGMLPVLSPEYLTIDHSTSSLTITSPSSPSASSQHINHVLKLLVDRSIDQDIYAILNRTHSEPFRILGARLPPATASSTSENNKNNNKDQIVHLERFAAPLFGIATRGSHMTCYTRPSPSSPPSDIKIWVARRSAHLYSSPNKLDSTVAGGVKAHETPTDCILAEASEEALLPADLVRSLARPAGVLTLANRNPRTELFHGEVLYVYDMELPADVVPTPGDDEVRGFELMGVDEVRRRMENGEFKNNVCPVMVDFMIRHGIVTPESEGEGEYADVCSRLRRRLPMPLAPDMEA